MSRQNAQRAPRESYHLLVVDDHPTARASIVDVLQHAGYGVTACGSATEALLQLDRQAVDVVLTDLQMPGMDGLELVRELQRRRSDAEILMITAYASVSSAVEAMRMGAFDYLEKPFDAAQLEKSVRQACQRKSLTDSERELARPTTQQRSTAATDRLAPAMIGSSPVMERLRSKITQVATTDETVLICGESGTGKELVAQSIHRLSRRCPGPWVSLNCPVLSAQLTESELFGHKRGAFTGAEADRSGRFEMANGGTILLDEVTEIDVQLQAKLLRVLQERSFERVGSSETTTVDVRVLATTNRDLLSEVDAGRLREDLYYRLAVLPIELPPLRQRGGDVQELTDHFLDQAASRLGRPRVILDSDARQLLASYHWPGNVRELQNVITRASVLIHDRPIRATDLQPWLRPSDDAEQRGYEEASVGLPVGSSLEEVERQMIVATLERFDGHRAKTAAALGIGVRTLSGKLRAYGYAPREKSFAKAG